MIWYGYLTTGKGLQQCRLAYNDVPEEDGGWGEQESKEEEKGGETEVMSGIGVDWDICIHIQWNLSIKDTLNKEHLSNEDSATLPTA